MMAMFCPSPPVGPALFGLKFNDLDGDCLLEIFKRLPFKAMIKYQRVDSKWGRLLESIWTKQTVLCSNCKVKVESRFCRNKDHSFDQNFDGVCSALEDNSVWDRLTLKCPRLKAIYFENRMWPEVRLKYLSSCTRLEHISFDDYSLLYLAPYFGKDISLNHVKCLSLSLTKNTLPIVQQLLKSTPRLEVLEIQDLRDYGHSDSETIDLVNALTPVLPYLLELRIQKPCDNDLGSTLLENIANIGQNIRSMSYSVDGIEDEFKPETEGRLLRLLVKKMTNLETIDIMGRQENLTRLPLLNHPL